MKRPVFFYGSLCEIPPPPKIYSGISNCILRDSGFHREVAENCALLGYYTAGSGNFLPTFRDNLLVPFLGFKNPTGFLYS